MSMSIRRLTEADAAAYRALRLEGLQANPEAFGSSFEDEQAHDVGYFAQRLRDTAYFGAFDGVELVGSAAVLLTSSRKSAHIGNLVGVYLRASHRGKGMAQQLLETALTFAAGRVKQIHLGVGADNGSAQRLYERLGFVRYGTEPRSLYVNGRYIDEHLMVRFFDKAPERQTND